ncbi:hypothetical protein TNCT_143001 [Trichonephila clavata]|uniref:Uncharacterized protein n=1 Tax=Trichonephila clavata TaxID=2740835 RepID=A0A8X6FLB7_TRICU|nr:hypothetical protein TNCT_143001 [Trichonephila clavata]
MVDLRSRITDKHSMKDEPGGKFHASPRTGRRILFIECDSPDTKYVPEVYKTSQIGDFIHTYVRHWAVYATSYILTSTRIDAKATEELSSPGTFGQEQVKPRSSSDRCRRCRQTLRTDFQVSQRSS